METKSLCQCDIDPKGEDACAKNPMLIAKAFTLAIISALLDEVSQARQSTWMFSFFFAVHLQQSLLAKCTHFPVLHNVFLVNTLVVFVMWHFLSKEVLPLKAGIILTIELRFARTQHIMLTRQ